MVKQSHLLLLVAVLNSFLTNATSLAAEELTLDTFLDQVRASNSGIKAAVQSQEASQMRSDEGKLLLSPTAYFNGRIISDAKLPPALFLLYDAQILKSFSFGVRKLTTFGLEANLHYDLYSQFYTNPFLPPAFASFAGAGGSPVILSYANAAPTLELTQSLWGNGFGRSTRAQQEQLEASQLSQKYQASFQWKAQMIQAETAYWQLVLARQAVNMQKEALERARKIYQWSSQRARLHLADKADAIQAQALVQTRELELESTENQERSAARNFNSSRNVNSDRVPEALIDFDSSALNDLKIPTRAALRDDVKAAQEATRASTAGAILGMERNKPTLSVFAGLSLNGQSGYTPATNLSNSISQSFSFNRPTKTIGIRFEMPLSFSLLSRSTEGLRKEQIAAELNYDRKVFEQEQNWKELNDELSDIKKHLALSRKLEQIQKSKLVYEKNRLNQGRTTTFQVLQFEQEYLLAQLNRIRDQAQALNILAKMKLFGETI